MTNKNKMIFGTASALIFGLVTGTYLLSGLNKASFAKTRAVKSFGQGRSAGIERPCSDEDFQAIQDAIAKGDYNAWKELSQKYADSKSGKGAKWVEIIDSQEKFAKFTQMKQLMDQGKFEEARALRLELGFPAGPNGGGRGQHQDQFKNSQ